MNLVSSRNKMLERYLHRGTPSGVLEDYRKYRNSEMWRTGRVVEELCEYILYLEKRLEE